MPKSSGNAGVLTPEEVCFPSFSTLPKALFPANCQSFIFLISHRLKFILTPTVPSW